MRQLGPLAVHLGGMRQRVRNVMEGRLDRGRWLIFDHWADTSSFDGLEVTGATVIVLQGAARAPGPLAVGAGLTLNLDDGRNPTPLFRSLTGDVQFDSVLSLYVPHAAGAEWMGPALRQALTQLLSGPLGDRWDLIFDGGRLILWYDASASPAQIAHAMEALRSLQALVE